MSVFRFFGAIAAGVMASALVTAALGRNLDVPGGDLERALKSYIAQTGVQLVFSTNAVKGVRTNGAKSDADYEAALSHILAGTGFVARRDEGVITIVRDARSSKNTDAMEIAAAPAPTVSGAALETVTVTSSKIGGDVQNIPISITALSQEQLTATQTAGGPDLVKQVPNLTFSKTNFSGYNIQIRGIGTQAISVTTDPAVAVAFNDIPFIRNHFFEQEFYDVSQVEVLRGPQGTLYGRNATAGVVNLVSAKPTDQFEAMVSADIGNYENRRFEGMVNIPIVDDHLDIRLAGEWTKRNGYTFDQELGQSTDGRDLWSGRMTIGWKPVSTVQTYLVWEHFSEDDDRLRSGKQLCTTANAPAVIDGPTGPIMPTTGLTAEFLSQGCAPGSLYGPDAFGTPKSGANPFIFGLQHYTLYVPGQVDPYAGVTQPQNLRIIDSQLKPSYRAKNDTVELNTDYNLTPALTLTSQTGYNEDSLYSTEDFDRFNSGPGFFLPWANPVGGGLVGEDGEYCDPQLGCSNRLVGEDVSSEHAQQVSQEVRLASNYTGPFNFSVGANYLYYQTLEDYYVFFNTISLFAESFNTHWGGLPDGPTFQHVPFNAALANSCGPQPALIADPDPSTAFGLGCSYIDPNPLGQVDGEGHNYFLSINPYRLNSYAGFGEVYYQLTPDLKLTGGLRWTDDNKSFTDIPSWAGDQGKGLPVASVIDQSWREWTGRFNASWTPKLDFTDQSLFYGSYSRGYKGGGANPPGVVPIVARQNLSFTSPSDTTHPLTFKPEFVDAFELGTKNTLLDGAMTFNGDIFYYKYQNYQISQIVDRTSVNLNFNANVQGAEIESSWEPVPGLRFNLGGGYENATLANGSQAIDLMDRTAGHPGWLVVKPFPTETSNCVLPTYVVNVVAGADLLTACQYAYGLLIDPRLTPVPGYPGFDPLAGTPGDPYHGQNTYNGFDYGPAPNDGQGFLKNLSGNKLPNAPPFTLSLGSQYSMPLSADWVGTLRGDFYWQGNSEARVFNDKPYDSIHGFTNLNLTLIFTSQNGWQAMGYVKNVLNTTAITGDFLNPDDTGLTTNVFLTDPRLFGVRLTKNW